MDSEQTVLTDDLFVDGRPRFIKAWVYKKRAKIEFDPYTVMFTKVTRYISDKPEVKRRYKGVMLGISMTTSGTICGHIEVKKTQRMMSFGSPVAWDDLTESHQAAVFFEYCEIWGVQGVDYAKGRCYPNGSYKKAVVGAGHG